MQPLRRRLPLASSLLLGLVACRTPSSRLPIDEIVRGDATAGPTGEARERVEPLPVQAPADLLPAEIAVVAEALEPSAVLAQIVKLDKYPEFQGVRAEVRGELGVDLLDAEQWQRIGLDRHGPAGVGLLDIEAQGLFAYVSLTDAGVFADFIEDLAGRRGVAGELGIAELERARVYRFGDELSLILREGVAVFVFVDRADRAARDYAATIATIDPREALSHTQAFTWARAQLEVADQGLVFVAPRELIAQVQRKSASSDSDYGVRYAEDELARARNAGDPPETIEMLERRVEEERRWIEERELRRTAERELVRVLFEPIAAFALAGELRDDAISAHARALMPEPGLLGRLFVPVSSESPLLRAVDERPLVAIDGQIDVQAALELAELLARADGENLSTANDMLRMLTGVDVIGQVLPTLSGRAGLMITQQHPPDPRKLGEVERSFGLAAYVELSDADALRQLIDGVARGKMVPGLGRGKRGDGWLIELPKWHNVHVDIVGNRLIASTDAKLAERIRDAKPGRQAEALADASHPLRGPIPTPALRLYMRWLWLALVDAHEPWTQEPEALLWDLNTHHTLSPDEAAAVPRSREFKRKFKDFERAVAALDAHQHREAERRFERELEIAETFGDAGLQIERLSDGLGARALWRMAPGTVLLDLWMPLMVGSDRSDWSEYERLQREVDRTREELMQVRRADLDAAATKRQP